MSGRAHASARPAPVEPERFRQIAGYFVTGVTVLCTIVRGEPRVMTANSFLPVSLEPPLVLVSVRAGSRWLADVAPGTGFAISVLSDAQQPDSRRFASPDRLRDERSLAGITWQPALCTGSPVLSASVAYFDCVVDSLVPAGDHVLVVAGVRALGDLRDEVSPLVFWRGRYWNGPSAEVAPISVR
ncbi:flavin reductase family protein [Amycolatopsis sp. WAC 01416]|uniref:flavin reductase family protein n=1 Tax=Amycolatopsis sp. WAC 01416 TaxID=2203196 RepID=UPI0013153146|nr:flavin reductase family protein [Amycolatopsis sp. WAC 01416]